MARIDMLTCIQDNRSINGFIFQDEMVDVFQGKYGDAELIWVGIEKRLEFFGFQIPIHSYKGETFSTRIVENFGVYIFDEIERLSLSAVDYIK